MSPVAGDPEKGEWFVSSQSWPGVWYRVAMEGDGADRALRCSCPATVEVCRHIRELVNGIVERAKKAGRCS